MYCELRVRKDVVYVHVYVRTRVRTTDGVPQVRYPCIEYQATLVWYTCVMPWRHGMVVWHTFR